MSTEKINEFFNMANDSTEEIAEKKDVAVVDNSNTNLQVPDMDQYILQLSDVSQHSKDMDSLAEKAMDGYEEIMEFAREADPRNVGHVLAAAVSMHGNAMAAKESKMKASIQAANLMLRKKAMDDKKPLADAGIIESDDAEGNITGDRNKILDAIKGMSD